jgi:hypothetical protein
MSTIGAPDTAAPNERRFLTWGVTRDAVVLATTTPGEHIPIERLKPILDRKLHSPVEFDRLEAMLEDLADRGEVALFKSDTGWRVRYEGLVILNGRNGVRYTPVLSDDPWGDPWRSPSWQNVRTLGAPVNVGKWALLEVTPW